jgi:hypothetical protein
MLTLEDRIALSDLTHEEIDAIAEHEHLPETIAAELGCTRAASSNSDWLLGRSAQAARYAP